MTSLPLTILAMLVSAVDVVIVARIADRLNDSDPRTLVLEVVDLLRSGRRTDAVEKLTRESSGAPIRALLLGALGLELPTSAPTGSTESDYRSAPAVQDFSSVVSLWIRTETARLRRVAVGSHALAIGWGLLTSAVSAASMIAGVRWLRVSSMCWVTVGVIGTVFAARSAIGVARGLSDVEARIAPLLKPVESMSATDRSAASTARAESAAFTLSGGVTTLGALAMWAIFWFGVALLAR